jgi:hypothetical protein
MRMPDYRIYILNPQGHIAEPPHIVTCDSDQAATERALQLLEDQDFEVWQGPRLVNRRVAGRSAGDREQRG